VGIEEIEGSQAGETGMAEGWVGGEEERARAAGLVVPEWHTVVQGNGWWQWVYANRGSPDQPGVGGGSEGLKDSSRIGLNQSRTGNKGSCTEADNGKGEVKNGSW